MWRGTIRCTGGGSDGQCCTSATGNCIVWFARIVLIPVSIYPLEEFEVILETTFYETVYWDCFVDVVVYECLLKGFEVLNVFVFVFCVELGK